MHRSSRLFAVCLLSISGLAWSQLASAQQSEICSYRSPSVQEIVCLRVAATSVQAGDNVQIEAWLEVPVSGGYARAPGHMAVYDGSATVLFHGDASSGNSYTLSQFYQFTSVRQYVLRANHVNTYSPTITVTVSARHPQFTFSVTPTISRVGQTVQLSNETLLFRPNGVMAFFVQPPGGSPVEFIRYNDVQPNYMINSTHLPNFSFLAPYNTPGEYRFFVRYLGDPLNSAGESQRLSVQVGPFSTTTQLMQSMPDSMQGSPFTLTATVTGGQAGNPAPTGTVEFYDATTLLGTGTLNAQRVATFTGRMPRVGAHSLTARYLGDTNNQASTSAAISHQITFNPSILIPINELLME